MKHFELINTLQLELPFQIEVNNVGNKLDIGLSNKHSISRVVKPTKQFLSNETILLDSKFNSTISDISDIYKSDQIYINITWVVLMFIKWSFFVQKLQWIRGFNFRQ